MNGKASLVTIASRERSAPRGKDGSGDWGGWARAGMGEGALLDVLCKRLTADTVGVALQARWSP